LFSDAFGASGVDVELGDVVTVLTELLAQLETDGAGTDD